jgi:hypothetical protein
MFSGKLLLATYILTYYLHGAESFLRSILVLQLVKKFPAFGYLHTQHKYQGAYIKKGHSIIIIIIIIIIKYPKNVYPNRHELHRPNYNKSL